FIGKRGVFAHVARRLRHPGLYPGPAVFESDYTERFSNSGDWGSRGSSWGPNHVGDTLGARALRSKSPTRQAADSGAIGLELNFRSCALGSSTSCFLFRRVDPTKTYAVMTRASGSMRHSFSYEIRNHSGALQSLKRELDKTLFIQEQDPAVRSTVLLVADELVSNLLKYGFKEGSEQCSHVNITLD